MSEPSPPAHRPPTGLCEELNHAGCVVGRVLTPVDPADVTLLGMKGEEEFGRPPHRFMATVKAVHFDKLCEPAIGLILIVERSRRVK